MDTPKQKRSKRGARSTEQSQLLAFAGPLRRSCGVPQRGKLFFWGGVSDFSPIHPHSQIETEHSSSFFLLIFYLTVFSSFPPSCSIFFKTTHFPLPSPSAHFFFNPVAVAFSLLIFSPIRLLSDPHFSPTALSSFFFFCCLQFFGLVVMFFFFLAVTRKLKVNTELNVDS